MSNALDVDLFEENERLCAENAKLRMLLGKLRWKSIEKDNMEWRCETTAFVIDEIRAALDQGTSP